MKLLLNLLRLLLIMSKPTQTPLGRTARLLDLVPFLATHQGIELKTLSENFDVTDAQMVADLTTLWMCGLPGYTPLELMDLSFESGFVTIHNAETLSHPRALSDEEIIALLLGLDVVIASLPNDRSDLKLIALDLVARLSTRSSIPSKMSAVPAAPGSVRAIIERSLLEKEAVEILYHSSYSDEISRRVVTPIELREENGFEYLWGVCQSAHGLRSFRLDRIQEAAPKSNSSQPIPAISGSQSHGISYTIHAHSRPREVIERFAINKEEFTENARVVSFSHEWIKRSVLASAGSVEVVEPDNIRAEILRSAQSLLERY
jgi:proteasome accessory factor C